VGAISVAGARRTVNRLTKRRLFSESTPLSQS